MALLGIGVPSGGGSVCRISLGSSALYLGSENDPSTEVMNARSASSRSSSSLLSVKLSPSAGHCLFSQSSLSGSGAPCSSSFALHSFRNSSNSRSWAHSGSSSSLRSSISGVCSASGSENQSGSCCLGDSHPPLDRHPVLP